MKTCVIVTGMHRSGTSLCAGIVNILGAEIGAVLGPRIGINDKGYFEHKKIMRNNQYLLESLKLDWKSTSNLPTNWVKTTQSFADKAKELITGSFDSSDLFCIKDPRICRLFPMWTKVLSDLGINVRVIFCVRHPYDVASSLHRRDKIPQNKAIELWQIYNKEFLDNMYNDVVFCQYNEILDKSEEFIKKITHFINHHKLKDYSLIKDSVGSFVEKDLCHHRSSDKIKDSGVAELYKKLIGACND